MIPLLLPTHAHPAAPVQTGGFKTKSTQGFQVELLGVDSFGKQCSVTAEPRVFKAPLQLSYSVNQKTKAQREVATQGHSTCLWEGCT